MSGDRRERVMTNAAMMVVEQQKVVIYRSQLVFEKSLDPASMDALDTSRRRLAEYLDLWRIASEQPEGTSEMTLLFSAEQWVATHPE